jgi:pimeloyl-ACP methyl ester carboxylesterase
MSPSVTDFLPAKEWFGGTRKADGLTGVSELAQCYVTLLEQLDLTDVTVIGNSFGGWLAAEMALRNSPRVSGAVIIDGIGVEIPGHPMADVSGLSRTEILALSFHDPSKAPVPPNDGDTGPSPDVQALLGYTGPTLANMSDPTLAKRLGALDLPVHVLRGESDHTWSTPRTARPTPPHTDVDVHAASPHRPPAAGRDARGSARCTARPLRPVTSTTGKEQPGKSVRTGEAEGLRAACGTRHVSTA